MFMGRLILTNARLINGTGEQPKQKASMLITNGKIEAIADDPMVGKTRSSPP